MIDETLDAKAIFKVACLIDSREARNVYLNQVCGANGGLHARVVALLEAHDQPSDFLESPAAGAAATVDPAPIAERPGTTIGRYRLVEEVGEGGMGGCTRPSRRSRYSATWLSRSSSRAWTLARWWLVSRLNGRRWR